MKGKTKAQKGITLVALIITIVVLLILAVVAVTAIQNDGILEHANNAATGYNQKQEQENTFLNEYEGFLNNYLGNGGSGNTEGYEEVTLAFAITDDMYDRTENSQTKDIHGNIIKIPAGFKILVDDTTVYTGVTDIDVAKGIVIIDEAGNEFVYVPVGAIKTASETKNITLARYEFDITIDSSTYALGGTGAVKENGIHTSATDELTDPVCALLAQSEGLSNIVFVEGKIEEIDDQGKGYALNIVDFITKASSGYYIGRYEARTNSTTERAKGDSLTNVTLNKTNAVYNYITQPDATSKCQSMYTDKPFTTDIINSFAWDTAIAFIQSFEDNDYSMKTTVNTELSNTGTVGLEIQDKVCNIYDMASNCFEWSTETVNHSILTCSLRGGSCHSYIYYSAYRQCQQTSTEDTWVEINGDRTYYGIYSFRPVLYL